VAEARGCKVGFDNLPWQARSFYAVIGAIIVPVLYNAITGKPTLR